MKYFLCLGSNLGDRAKNLERALVLLEEAGVKIVQRSSLYETQPVDLTSQPWFFNQVVEAESNLNAHDLLGMIKYIEKRIGGKAPFSRGPRLIDIDILLAEENVVQTEELVIPHPRLDKRNFVLIPLSEISPQSIHPLFGEKIEDLCRKSKDTSLVKKIENQEKILKSGEK
jgi:2-amino-4-hydroxy-6-hydroxymethyldihydropteridine diphosphokinase